MRKSPYRGQKVTVVTVVFLYLSQNKKISEKGLGASRTRNFFLGEEWRINHHNRHFGPFFAQVGLFMGNLRVTVGVRVGGGE
jgi:hypothetical protein